MNRKALLPLRMAICLLSMSTTACALAQDAARDIAAMRRQIESLQAEQRTLKRELAIIKDTLGGKEGNVSAPPLPDLSIETKGSASLGTADAKVVLVEFSDFQCPFCARFSTDVFGPLLREYVNTGRVQYVMKSFPLFEVHPHAREMAEAAACAGEQGKYPEMRESLFRHQQDVASELLIKHARALGVDQTRFQHCLGSEAAGAKVEADLQQGRILGVDGTPTFFFGYRDAKEPTKIKAVKMLTGAQPLLSFTEVLEYLLDPPPTTAVGGHE